MKPFDHESTENRKKVRKSQYKEILRKNYKASTPTLHSNLKSPYSIRNKQRNARNTQTPEKGDKNYLNSPLNSDGQSAKYGLGGRSQKNLMSENKKKLNNDAADSYYAHQMTQKKYEPDKRSSSKIEHNKLSERGMYDQADGLQNIKNDSESECGSYRSGISSKHRINSQKGKARPQLVKKCQQANRRSYGDSQKLKAETKQLQEKYEAVQKEKHDIERQRNSLNNLVKLMTTRNAELEQKIIDYHHRRQTDTEEICVLKQSAAILTVKLQDCENELKASKQQLKASKQVIHSQKRSRQEDKQLLEKSEQRMKAYIEEVSKLKEQKQQLSVKFRKLNSALKEAEYHSTALNNNIKQGQLRKPSTRKSYNFSKQAKFSQVQTATTVKALEFDSNFADSKREDTKSIRNRQSYPNTLKVNEPNTMSSSDFFCKACEAAADNISQLVAIIENQLFQLLKKDNIIKNLWAQVQKIQGQLRLLEKPQAMYRHLNGMITELNQQINLERVKQLNLKYEIMPAKSVSKNMKVPAFK